MARKMNQGIKSKMPEGKVSIVYVKKAKMWCKTWFETNDRGVTSQRQDWSTEKPEDNSSK